MVLSASLRSGGKDMDMHALRLARKVRRQHAIQDQKQLVCDLQAKKNQLQGCMHGLEAELCWWQDWYYDYGGDSVSHYIKHEVCNRISCIAPVLEEKVSAAMEQRQPKITGSKRLRRNAAEHVFNQGLDVSRASDSELRRAQRGKRTLVQGGIALVLNDITATESTAVAVPDPATVAVPAAVTSPDVPLDTVVHASDVSGHSYGVGSGGDVGLRQTPHADLDPVDFDNRVPAVDSGILGTVASVGHHADMKDEDRASFQSASGVRDAIYVPHYCWTAEGEERGGDIADRFDTPVEDILAGSFLSLETVERLSHARANRDLTFLEWASQEAVGLIQLIEDESGEGCIAAIVATCQGDDGIGLNHMTVAGDSVVDGAAVPADAVTYHTTEVSVEPSADVRRGAGLSERSTVLFESILEKRGALSSF